MLRYLVFLLVLTGCQAGPDFMITGQLTDKTSDGEWIYLVPLENASKERVDSVMIVNGVFRFEGSAETPEIYILRAKPVLRFTLQELLVVKEPGNLVVKIGKNSMVTGTALNDSLQRWKELKLMSDYTTEELRQKMVSAGEPEQAELKRKADSLNTRIVDFHFNFVRNNQGNVVGKFVNSVMGNSFSPEQKKCLNLK